MILAICPHKLFGVISISKHYNLIKAFSEEKGWFIEIRVCKFVIPVQKNRKNCFRLSKKLSCSKLGHPLSRGS